MRDNEWGSDEDGNRFPLFCGLSRLAEEAGKVKERVTKMSLLNTYYDGGSTPIAQITVEVDFDDGTTWIGTADAYRGNCRKYAFHPSSMAETRALSRAYRRALNIHTVAYEEVSDVPGSEEITNITSQQAALIHKLLRETEMPLIELIRQITTRDEVTSVEKFLYEEAQSAIQILNDFKKEQMKVKRKEYRSKDGEDARD